MAAQKTIFWDYDKTLAQPTRWSSSLLNAMDSVHPGHGITREHLKSYLQTSYPWHTPEIPHPELSDADSWWNKLLLHLAGVFRELGFSNDEATAMTQLIRPFHINAENYRLYDDTIPALERLKKQGWRHIILSNHIPELPEIIEALPLAHCIDDCVSSGLAGWEKPHPAIYRYALDRAGHPENVWMIGDSITADIRGAEAAGIPAILVRQPSEQPVRYYADTLTEAAAIIEKGE